MLKYLLKKTINNKNILFFHHKNFKILANEAVQIQDLHKMVL